MIDDEQFVAQKPDVDYRQLATEPSPEDYFLLSRVTGVVSVARLCSVSGLGRDKTLSTVQRLLDVGLLRVVDESGNPIGGSEPEPEPQARPEPEPEPQKPEYPGEGALSVASEVEPMTQAGLPSSEDISPDEFDDLAADEGSPLSEPSEGSVFGGEAAVSGVVVDEDDDDDLFMPTSPAHRAKVDGRFVDSVDMAAFAHDDTNNSPNTNRRKTSPGRPAADELDSGGSSSAAGDSEPVVKAKASRQPDLSRFPRDFDSYELDVPVADGIDPELQREIYFVFEQLDEIDFYQLFGVDQDADRKPIRKSYFKMSKRFHPDKYFRAEATEVAERVEAIFKFITKGYQTLSKQSKRDEYDVALKRARLDAEKETAEHDRKRSMAADMLQKRAEQLESNGNLKGAADELQKVATLRREPSILLKAANLLLRSNSGLDQAAQLARAAAAKMPDEVEPRLVLGRIYEKNDMMDEAVEVLEEAVSLAPEDPSVRVHLERVRSRL